MIQHGKMFTLNAHVVRNNKTILYDSNPKWHPIVIVPEGVSENAVKIAWTSAVRYTAESLDQPNWNKALERLLEFHPDWTVMNTRVGGINVDLSIKEDDHPSRI